MASQNNLQKITLIWKKLLEFFTLEKKHLNFQNFPQFFRKNEKNSWRKKKKKISGAAHWLAG